MNIIFPFAPCICLCIRTVMKIINSGLTAAIGLANQVAKFLNGKEDTY